MSRISIAFIILSVCMSAVAQLLLKGGMSSVSVQRALAQGPSFKAAFDVFTNIGVLSGLFVYFASALVWLIVLSKVEVSLAYPFVSLGLVLTAVMGHVLFGEALSTQRIIGIMLVCVGVAVLARG